MSVEEAPMRPGSGSLQLTDDAPLSLTKAIYDLVVGAGCHIVITPTPIDPTTVSDATMLSTAMYTGRVIDRPDRTSIGFTGVSSWLDSYTETAFTRTAGTPTNWVDDVLVNGLTRGTVSGGSNVTRSFPAYAQTRRQILDAVSSEGGWEYEVRPDFSINAGTSVFTTTPTVVITNKSEGPDGTYTGLLGGFTDQNVDASNITTKVVALGSGSGSSIVTGTATKTPALKDKAGNTPTLVQVVSAPSASTTVNADAIAAAINTAAAPSLAMTILTQYVRRARGGSKESPAGGTDAQIIQRLLDKGQDPGVNMGTNVNWSGVLSLITDEIVSGRQSAAASAFASATLAGTGVGSAAGGGGAESQFIRRILRAGDNVYVYDLESGLFNTSQQITYRGEVIFPQTKRVLSMTWACERGYGYYIRSNAATPVYYDLTPYVAYEDPGATLEVGDRPAESYAGIVNRSNPLIEPRVNTPGRIDWTSVTVAQGAAVTGSISRGWYVKRPDGTWTAKLVWVATAAGTAANAITVSLPVTLVDVLDIGGDFFVVDAAPGNFYTGAIAANATTSCLMAVSTDETGAITNYLGIDPAFTLASGDQIRLTLHGSY